MNSARHTPEQDSADGVQARPGDGVLRDRAYALGTEGVEGSECAIFDTPEYMGAWLDCHLGAGRPWTVTLGDAPSGRIIAPLVLGRERRLWASLQTLKPIGWNLRSSNVCIPFAPAHLRRLVSYLLGQRGKWDTLEFSLLLDHLSLSEGIIALVERAGLHEAGHSHAECPYISLRCSWEAYFRQRNKSLRKDIARVLHKMERAGGVSHRYVEGPEAAGAFDPLFELHQKRWARCGQQSKYAQARHRNFLKMLACRCDREHRVGVHSLVVAGKTVASAACFVGAQRLYYHLVSFDPDFSELSPGKVLLHHIVRDAYRKGLREVDLGPGKDGYKHWWSTGERVICRFVFAHHRALALWLRTQGAVRNTARTALTRLGRRRS